MNILVHQVADYYRQIYQEDINHFGAKSPLGIEWASRLEKIDNIEFAADKGYTNTAEALYQISKLYHG
jgi:hypothetical protein